MAVNNKTDADIVGVNTSANKTSLGHVINTVTFWSTNQQNVTIPAVGSAADQTLPSVVIPASGSGGIPTGATILTVFGIVIFGSRHNSNASANNISGPQNLKVEKSAGGSWTTFHAVPDLSLPTAAGGTSPTGDGAGGVFMGSVNVVAQVSANGTYNFEWALAGAAQASLILYDVQVGLVVTYSL